MWRAGRTLLVLPALGALALLTADCREPTQITLEITTDVKCEDLGNTSITVGRLGDIEEKPASTTTTRCTESGRVGSLVIVPSGDKDGEVAIRIVTGVKKTAEQCVVDAYQGGCIVARRAVRYVPHTPLTLPVDMSVDCLDIPCEVTETCFKGGCVPAKIKCEEDPASCQPDNPDGGPIEAAPPDVTVDVGPDVVDAGVDADAEAGEVDVTVTCPTDKGECDGDLSQLCESDLPSDAKNCGACGRDCLGGTCTTGSCSAVPILTPTGTDPPEPTRLVLDDKFIYFVEADKRVFRMPKEGGQAVVLASGQTFANTLVIDDTFVYWTDNASSGAVRKVPKVGGATTDVVPLANNPIGIINVGSDLYFANFISVGAINAVPITGGPVVPLVQGEVWPRDLAVIDTYIYWTTVENNGFLKRVLLTGGTPEVVDSDLPNTAAIAKSATHVYYTVIGNGNDKGEIRRAAVDTLQVDLVAIGQDQPLGLAVDSEFAYWTTYGDGTLKKAPLAGGAPITLVSNLNHPLGIALDDVSIYFADTDNSRIMRVAK